MGIGDAEHETKWIFSISRQKFVGFFGQPVRWIGFFVAHGSVIKHRGLHIAHFDVFDFFPVSAVEHVLGVVKAHCAFGVYPAGARRTIQMPFARVSSVVSAIF